MVQADELVLKVRADTAGAQKNITGFADHTRQKMQAVGQSFTNAGRTLTTRLTLPIAGFVGVAVKKFFQQEEATAKLQSSFESMGAEAWTSMEALQGVADSLQANSTFGDEAVETMQAILLTFGQIKNAGEGANAVFDRTTQVTADMAALMGTDLNSAAVMLGKALNDPVANLGALSRSGVQFTKDQKEMIKGLWEAGDTLGAQKLILEELERQFGGTAEAVANTASGKWKQAMNKMGDAMETVGGIVAPIVVEIADHIAKLAESFDNMDPYWQKLTIGAAGAAAGLGPLLLGLGTFIKIITFAMTPIGLIIAAIAAIGFVAVKMGLKWEDVVSWFQNVFLPTMQPIFEDLLAFVTKIIEIVTEYFEENIGTWVENFQKGLTTILEVFTEIWNTIEPIIRDVVDFITTEVQELIDWWVEIWPMVQEVVEKVLTILWDTWQKVWGTIERHIGNIWNGIKNIISGAMDFVQGIIQTVLAVITGDWGAAWDGIKQTFEGAWNVLKGIIQVAWEALNVAWETVVNALELAWETVWLGMGEVVSTVFEGIVAGVKTGLNAVISVLETGLQAAVNGVNATIRGINIVNPFKDVPYVPDVNLPRLAEGGVRTHGGPVRLGERGMEVVNLPAGASVRPLDASDTGGGPSVWIDRLEGGDPKKVAQEIGWEFAKRGVA